MEFSRPEYWSGLPLPSPGDLPDPRDRTQISCIAGRFFTSEHQGSPSHAPGSPINAIQKLSYLILQRPYEERECYYPHLGDGDAEA